MDATAKTVQAIESNLYEGVLDDTSWKQALTGIAELAGAPYACLMSRNANSGYFEFLETVDTPEAAIRAYNEEFHALNPINTLPVLRRPTEQYLDRQVLGERLEKLPFYQEFLRPHGISFMMGHKVGIFEGVDCNLSIHRTLGEQPFDDMAAARVAHLHTALERGFKLRFRLRALEQQNLWNRGALDRLGCPILIADAQANMLQTNQAADAWLRGRDAMFDRMGRTRFVLPKIQRILRQACGLDGPVRSAAVQLPDGRGSSTVLMIALPLPEAQAEARALYGRAAMLVVLGAGLSTNMPRAVLQSVFHLTPAEIRLLSLLARQDSLREAAETLSVSHETARTQLKSILHKTGARRQQELMRLTTELGLLPDDPPPARGLA
ncbi:transcriptional regulator [Bordetella ansorpii]|uniref:Transcriptional regulator n=1 Tax=Bordetella ansorpii TaxID=288768 RepID=A0A157Q950_9BORD|nr:helix-turn-helix transcriptional regulator [Bordetella ansorpii]SAI42110.1 transcriptional regulator [Bordetella ansorpii]